MSTTVYFTNNLSIALPTSVGISTYLNPSDWTNYNVTSLPAASLDVPIVNFNRDEGITDGDTWSWTIPITVAGVEVNFAAQITGTWDASTIGIIIYIGPSGSTNTSGWSYNDGGPISLNFQGNDGNTYVASGSYIPVLTDNDNVSFTITRVVMPQIAHIVVLMMENRSLDNLLGWLYDGSTPNQVLPANGPAAFDGLNSTYSNTASTVGAEPVYVTNGTTAQTELEIDPLETNDTQSFTVPATQIPNPDPGEEFANVAAQISGGMSGFLDNYIQMMGLGDNDEVGALLASSEGAAQIMQSYSTAQVPVISSLATSFAVSDAWYASVPSQTWPNRCFALTGTAYGQTNNAFTALPFPGPTIFDVVGAAGFSWTVYSDAPTGVPSLTRTLFSAEYLLNNDNFSDFSDFAGDLSSGGLATLSFIEPNFGQIGDDESYHPPHDIGPAENFLFTVYNQIRTSPYADQTLFVVLFDEHGGTYDHVTPPGGAAQPYPDPNATDGSGYAFNTFGVRVPAIVCSSYVTPGTVFRSPTSVPLDHTSVLATIRDWLGLPALFAQMLPSPRIAAAPTLEQLLTESSPQAWPDISSPAVEAAIKAVHQPVRESIKANDIQRVTTLAALAARQGKRMPVTEAELGIPPLKTLGDIRAAMRLALDKGWRPAIEGA